MPFIDSDYLRLTQSQINSYLKNDNASFDIKSNIPNSKKITQLLLCFPHFQHPIATYNLTTGYLVLLCPDYYIPSQEVLTHFMQLCQNRSKRT